MSIVNIAAYQFTPQPIESLQPRRDVLRSKCRQLELKGTILLSGEGINMFIAGPREAVDAVLAIVRSFPGFESIPTKESLTEYQPFRRMLVKIKREIIPVGCDDIAPVPEASPKIAPETLKQWLDAKKPITLLDTRNDYEVALGTFRGAVDLHLKNFREFPAAAQALPDSIKSQPVVMFCTGGIRCEKIGPYMKGLGFQEIYQLEGGILKYFEECRQEHYDGECFVFDQRIAVDPSLAPADAFECFACKHVLAPEDRESPQYREGVSCPYCYRDPEGMAQQARAEREARIQATAREQRGCTPHENRRWISIPGRCAGWPLLEALESIYPPYAREQWLAAIASGELSAPMATREQWRTERVSPDRIVREGERFLHVLPNCVEPAIDPDIRLIHEDDALVVIDKSAPLPLHPSGRYQLNTLESILNEAYAPEKLRPAHRIDSMTTGLVVLTRKYTYASRLQPQFSDGRVEKTYLAWVQGQPAWDATECTLAIGETPLPNGGRALDPNGAAASTRFEVVRREPRCCLVAAHPRTGRTHQIRLHLAALGHPIEGDPLYRAGGECIGDATGAANAPMMLHAWKIAIEHPKTGQRVTFTATRSSYDGADANTADALSSHRDGYE
jgi:RluA family pseudouridine synthase